MAKQWATLEGVLDGQLLVPALHLTVDGHNIFTQSQVWLEMYQKYSDFSFLYPSNAIPQEHFQRLYDNYIANMGNQYYRMFEGLQKKYNPINNYNMVEIGADGHKQSKRTNTDNTDSIAATTNSTVENEYSGTETNAKTTTGKQTTDHYENAFDSGISATGTHTARDETTFPTSVDDTRSFNNRKDTTKYTTTHQESLSDGSSVSGNTASKGASRNEKEEAFENNVSVDTTIIQPDDTELTKTLNGLTDGTQHIFSRSGNIGVLTPSDALLKELEVRKLNLLEMWVSGFIMEYCTFLGVEE